MKIGIFRNQKGQNFISQIAVIFLAVRVRECRWMCWKELALNFPERQRHLKSVQNSRFRNYKREQKKVLFWLKVQNTSTSSVNLHYIILRIHILPPVRRHGFRVMWTLQA